MTAARVATCVILLARLAASQSSDQPSSISGTVTNAITAEPILRAHVIAQCRRVGRTQGQQGPPGQQAFGALTAADGKFTIGQLPSGFCTLSVQRTGFVAGNNAGQYDIKSGSQREGVKLTLTPTGAIVGRVTDADGIPISGALVQAEGGSTNGTTTTDDRGQFRLGGVRAGRYRVKANSQEMPLPAEIRSDGSHEYHNATTYHPESLSAKEAQWVDAKAGAEVTADIRLVRTPIVEVSGKVVGLPDGLKDPVVVSAFPTMGGGMVKPDGTFSIWRLDPGKYELTVMTAGMGNGRVSLRSAPVNIEVGAQRLTNVELRMIPAFAVQGQFRFEDEDARNQAHQQSANGHPIQRQLTLNSINRMFGESMAGEMADDDSFKFANVQPGSYQVTLSGGVYVKSVRAGDVETDGQLLDLRNGAPGPVTLTISSRTCELTGKVGDSKGPATGMAVALVSNGAENFVHTSPVDPGGVYSFTGLFPGTYKVVPIDKEELSGGFNPENLAARDGAVEVELHAGDKVTKDLKR